MTNSTQLLNSFDQVVVLMMENRSFDNVMGYLYPPGSGVEVAGASGHSNQGPDHKETFTSPTATSHTPFPDPGEYMLNVMRQMYGDLFDGENYNPPNPPTMSGFINDYQAVLQGLKEVEPEVFRWPGNPAVTAPQIMQCQSETTLPALFHIARDFAVFDHWFCALPSATWPNRAFWHADTSYGFADNPSKQADWTFTDWLLASDAPTLFCQLDRKFPDSSRNWTIYSDQQPFPLTKFIHAGALMGEHSEDNFRYLEYEKSGSPNFFDDCAQGTLPQYSFLEPRFLNLVDHGLWHNDMHPSKFLSSPHWALWGPSGPGSITLGDQLLLKVYEALRESPQRDRTLFMLAFDEHGGCYDHVPPGTAAAPDRESFHLGEAQHGFEFRQLGPRVPMMMVSSHISAKTVVQEPLNHASFLAGLQDKWGLAPLGPRSSSATSFADVLPVQAQPREWEDYSSLKMHLETPDEKQLQHLLDDLSPLNDLQLSYFQALSEIAGVAPAGVETAQQANAVLRELEL